MSQEKILKVEHLHAYYGKNHVLQDVSLDILEHTITSIIGPSGCGKTTLIRTFNRLFETVESARIEGKIIYKNQNIFSYDPAQIRKEIGMVFQRPNPFPTMSIYKNVIAGYLLNGRRLSKAEADRLVEETLREVSLWDEVKDKLFKSPLGLSGGQQQRLCIARTIAVHPQVILLDEPCSALDPISTGKIEELMIELMKEYTIIIVTHNMQQAARVSNFTAFMMLGILKEFGTTDQIFTSPRERVTEEYITGRFG